MDADRVDIRRSFVDFFDLSTFLLAISLIAIGLISIYSATFDAEASVIFQRQASYALLGLFMLAVVVFVPERFLYRSAYAVYAVSIVLLLLLMALGIKGGGARSWLYLGPIGFQPSEVAKVGALLALARFISTPNVNLKTLRDLGIAAGIIAAPMLLVLMEPDPGTASVFAVMFFGIVLWAGADLFLLYAIMAPCLVTIMALIGEVPFYVAAGLTSLGALLFRRRLVSTALVVGIIIAAGFAPDALFQVLKPHQKKRIEVLLDPDADPRGAGYHVIQSKIAIGSGGLTGKGFLQGTQTQLRYVPKQWTDFIFCVPAEEFGFIGGVLVIGLLTGLVLRAVKTGEMARSKFCSVIAIGIAVLWFYHSTVNIGMALGLMPVMGIPLPFLSVGGTALVMNMALLGLLLNFYRNRHL